MHRTVLKTAILGALLGAALAANATDAYSNLGSPVAYRTAGSSNYNLQGFVQGAQFTTTASGLLSGFRVGINNQRFQSPDKKAITLKLYADSGSNTLGTLLGTYSGESTGVWYYTATSALSFVAATGPAVTLASGSKYWLVASGPSADGCAWNRSTSANGLRYVQGQTPAYTSSYLPAFSVQVGAVPEPTSLAALGLGALGLLKRRKRA